MYVNEKAHEKTHKWNLQTMAFWVKKNSDCDRRRRFCRIGAGLSSTTIPFQSLSPPILFFYRITACFGRIFTWCCSRDRTSQRARVYYQYQARVYYQYQARGCYQYRCHCPSACSRIRYEKESHSLSALRQTMWMNWNKVLTIYLLFLRLGLWLL